MSARKHTEKRTERWIALHQTAVVNLLVERSGARRCYSPSFSERLRGPWFRSRFDALLHASHALGMPGVAIDWRRDLGQERLAWGDRQ